MGLILRWIVGPMAGPVLGAAALAILAVGIIWWASLRGEIAGLNEMLDLAKKDRDGYRERIENPTSGYVRQVAQCLTNGEQLKAGLDRASADIAALAASSAANNKTLAANMAAAAKSAKGALDNSALILARPSTTQPGTLASCSAGEAWLRGRQP